MFQPSRGIVISLAMIGFHLFGHQVANGLGDRLGVGHDGCFQRRAVRSGGERAVEPANRGVEIVESQVGEPGGDLGPETKRCECLVDDQQPSGLGDRLADRVEVERGDGPRVDELDRDALGPRVARRP